MTLTTWGARQRSIPTDTQLLGSLGRTGLLSTIFGCKFSHTTLLAWMKLGPRHCFGSSSVRKPSATAKKDLSEISEDWRDPQIHMSRCVFEVWRRGGMKPQEPDTAGRSKEYEEPCGWTNVRGM